MNLGNPITSLLAILKGTVPMKFWRISPAVCALFIFSFSAQAALDQAKIEKLTGQKGQMDAKEGVFKVSLPRKDIQAEVAGAKITPPLGLTAWAAFTAVGKHTAVMGDIVLTEDQVNPVMSAALDAGLEVTALHNHFLYDSPRVMFMHIGGMGSEDTLAQSVGQVFTKLKETAEKKVEFPRLNVDPSKTSLNPKLIETNLGYSGDLKDGVYKVTIGRKTRMQGHEMGKAMGVNTWAAFAGSDDKAIVDGDFAMLESELQNVLKALRKANINIVAIHNHMTMESPRIIFLHFWGVGSTTELAKGLRLALDTQKLE
jgi:hypothetical protein